MADDMATRLMAKMRGSAQREEPEPVTTDPTTLALLRQARGETDYSYVHEANSKGQAEFRAAVQKRARELQGQHGLSYAFAGPALSRNSARNSGSPTSGTAAAPRTTRWSRATGRRWRPTPRPPSASASRARPPDRSRPFAPHTYPALPSGCPTA